MQSTINFLRSISSSVLRTAFFICCLLSGLVGWTQLFTQSAAQTNAQGSGLGVPMLGTPAANVLFSSAGKVNGSFGTGNNPCTNGYSGFTTVGPTSYSVTGPAIEITLSPTAGFVLSATGASAKMRYSATGPSRATYAYSIDGGLTWTNNGTMILPQANCQSGTTFTWNFPCSVIVGVSKTFKFRIYFYNSSGAIGTTQIENLTVNGAAVPCVAPTASISGTTTICGGGSSIITFSGTASSTVTYNINGGPNQTILLDCSGSATLNTGVLSATTTYNLVSVGFGTCSQALVGSVVVTVIPPVSSAVISGTNTICSGTSTNLTVNITGGVSPYTLVYSDGSSDITVNGYTSGSNISVSPIVNTVYTLVSVTSVSGCSSLSGSAAITISPAPTVAVLSGSATICNGASTNLSVVITGGSSPYTLVYFDGVANTTVNNYLSGSPIVVTPSATTSYSIVSVSSAAGCFGSGLSGTPTVTVRTAPTVTISGTATVCQNATSPTLTISNSQILAISVTYNINGVSPTTINIGATTSATISVPTTTAGTFTYNLVSVQYQSLPSCATTISGQSATITVNSLFTSAILSGSTTVCNGNSANLAVAISGGVSPYTVVYSDGSTSTTISNYLSGSSITVSPVVNTTYSLVSVTGSGDCGGAGIGGTASIVVSAPGTWLGRNSNWNDVQNWCDGNIPTLSTNVIIPAGVSFYPVITTVDPTANNITIAPAANLNITATGLFTFAGSVTNNGSINNSGSIVLQGTTGLQNFPGPGTIAPMNNLTINNASGVNLNKSLNIGGTLSLLNGTFTVGAYTLTINRPISGTPNNLSANNLSSIAIAGSLAGVNLPASVSQLRNLTISNSAGTVLQGNISITTLLFITSAAGTVDADLFTLNGSGSLSMSGGNLLLSKNGVVLPELNGSYNLTGGTITFNGLGVTPSDAQTIRPVNYFNLSSTSTGDRILSNSGTIGVSNIFSPSLNNYTVNGSTVNFNKTNNQNIPGFGFYNLTLSGGNFTKTLTGPISVEGTLSFSTPTKLSLANNDVTMRSNVANTASVAAISANNSILYGTGRFIVERFIPTGLSHGKSWQLLGVPTGAGQTLKEAWQEGATGGPSDNPNPGYGTQFTSSLPNAIAAGFDFFTPAGSTVKQYNSLLNAWEGVASTAQSISGNKGYMIFIRGDRSVTTFNQPAVPVTLRTRGKLYSPGTDAPPSSPIGAGKLEAIRNPYASAIDFINLITTSTGIDSKYYVWDPLLPGSFGYGAYQTISSSNGYMPVPGGTANYPTGVAYTKIQSGQAFFLYSTSGGNASFAESNKAGGSQLVYRSAISNLSDNRQYLRANLYTASGNLADGNAIAMSNTGNNAFEDADAIKLPNFGENFGIKHLDKILSVEARKPFAAGDTVYYRFSNLKQQEYRIMFNPENMGTLEFTPWLVDKFTGAFLQLSVTDTSSYLFNITADPASVDSARIYLVFRPLTPVPVLFTKLSAIADSDGRILINWEVDNEVNIDHYELQHNAGAQSFSTIYSGPARSNNGSSNQYNYVHRFTREPINFYRVKAVSKSGFVQYSNIAKVSSLQTGIDIYPNPVADKIIHVRFSDQIKSPYTIRLINSAGQIVFVKQINSANPGSTVLVKLEDSITAGTYVIQIDGDNGFRKAQMLIIQ